MSKEIENTAIKSRSVIKHHTYAVSCANDCTVCTTDGVQLVAVTAGVQATFIATVDTVVISDASAICELSFSPALASSVSSGGGLSEAEQALIGNACRVINYEAVELVDDEIAISIDPTTVPDYQLAELTELTVTSISIVSASSTTVATAAFWLTTGETAPSITWAEDAIWIDGTSVGSAPTLEANTKYRFAVSQEPDGQIIISLDYSYPYEQTT